MTDLALTFSEKLKAASRRPTIYGYRPHPKQQIFHESGKRGRIFIGGNRSGKTVAGSIEIVRAALGFDPYGKFPPPPLRLRACTVDQKRGIYQIILPELAKWIPTSALIDRSFEKSWDKENQTLYLANGSFIEILTYEQDVEKHAGTSRHAIWFDEEPPEEIYRENQGRLIDTNGTWWMTMTPVEGLEFIFELYEAVVNRGEDLNILVVQVDSYDNPYISAAAVEAATLDMTPEQRAARTKGMFAQLGGKIYTNFTWKNIKPEFEIPRNWIRIEGMDHGLRNQTSWLFCAIDPKTNNIYIYDEEYEAGLTIDKWAKRIHDKERKVGLPLYRVGDPSIKQKNAVTGTSIAYEYSSRGLPIVLGNNDVNAGIGKVATLFGESEEEAQLFITENCVQLVAHLKAYRWQDWHTPKLRATRNKKEEPIKKDDHDVDALRYIVAMWLEYRDEPPLPELGNPLGAPTVVTEEITGPEWEGSEENKDTDHPLGDEW